MTPEHKESFSRLFDAIYLGRKDAAELSFMLIGISHQWDDCVDQDKTIDKQSVNTAWRDAMITLPTNALFRAMPEMPYLVKDVYLKWCAANYFEKTGTHIEKAFVLRAELYGLFVHIASHIGGMEHAESVSPIVWSYYGEDLEQFKKEVMRCQIQSQEQ